MHFDLTEADMKYCGIDLHSNNSVVVVSDVEDRIVLQQRLPAANQTKTCVRFRSNSSTVVSQMVRWVQW
uniref:hypothetical protein n=1 Tax=Cupriavidus necator TaxID=106590 RepID=UPI003F4932D0